MPAPRKKARSALSAHFGVLEREMQVVPHQVFNPVQLPFDDASGPLFYPPYHQGSILTTNNQEVDAQILLLPDNTAAYQLTQRESRVTQYMFPLFMDHHYFSLNPVSYSYPQVGQQLAQTASGEFRHPKLLQKYDMRDRL